MLAMQTALVALAALTLAGCASSGVVLVGNETYVIRKQDSLGVTNYYGLLMSDLRNESQSFCLRTGRAAETVKETASTGLPVVQGATAELRFRCVAI